MSQTNAANSSEQSLTYQQAVAISRVSSDNSLPTPLAAAANAAMQAQSPQVQPTRSTSGIQVYLPDFPSGDKNQASRQHISSQKSTLTSVTPHEIDVPVASAPSQKKSQKISNMRFIHRAKEYALTVALICSVFILVAGVIVALNFVILASIGRNNFTDQQYYIDSPVASQLFNASKTTYGFAKSFLLEKPDLSDKSVYFLESLDSNVIQTNFRDILVHGVLLDFSSSSSQILSFYLNANSSVSATLSGTSDAGLGLLVLTQSQLQLWKTDSFHTFDWKQYEVYVPQLAQNSTFSFAVPRNLTESLAQPSARYYFVFLSADSSSGGSVDFLIRQSYYKVLDTNSAKIMARCDASTKTPNTCEVPAYGWSHALFQSDVTSLSKNGAGQLVLSSQIVPELISYQYTLDGGKLAPALVFTIVPPVLAAIALAAFAYYKYIQRKKDSQLEGNAFQQHKDDDDEQVHIELQNNNGTR